MLETELPRATYEPRAPTSPSPAPNLPGLASGPPPPQQTSNSERQFPEVPQGSGEGQESFKTVYRYSVYVRARHIAS